MNKEPKPLNSDGGLFQEAGFSTDTVRSDNNRNLREVLLQLTRGFRRDSGDNYSELVNGIDASTSSSDTSIRDQTIDGEKVPMVKTESEEKSKGQVVLKEFIDFFDKDLKSKIENLPKGKLDKNTKSELGKTIYANFLGGGVSLNDPQLRIEDYSESSIVDQLVSVMAQCNQELENTGYDQFITSTENRDYFEVFASPGCRMMGRGEDGFRLYLNCNAESAPLVVAKLVEFLQKGRDGSKVFYRAKVPKYLKHNDFSNRSDQIVFYFGGFDLESTQTALDKFSVTEEAKLLLDRKAVCSQFVTNSQGREITGLSFIQNPRATDKSANQVREELLVSLVERFHNFEGGNFDWEGEFRKVCEEYGIDAENPAFNLGGKDKFSTLFK